LPGTTAEGAWQMADNVCKSFPTDGALPECQVYSYPTQWPADGTTDDKTQAPVGSAADRAPKKTDNAPASAPGRIVEPMEVLFIQPLPVWKRSIDLCGAIFGGLAISPLLLAVALAVKLTSPGPVLFKQQRSGRGGKKFMMYKFRSMIVNAEAQKQALLALNEQDGPAFKIKADPRVTPIGRFLRKTSLDELPQLWNVIKGDMSLVGPRPLVCSESDACQGWQRRRLDVTPGLTCIFQAQGRVGTGFTDWMRMDVRYIKGRTLMHDARLLWKTIRAVVARKASH
jgi:lipopolysaccharide/colanic/teichoic acid biosynthesis glycosyltransferase